MNTTLPTITSSLADIEPAKVNTPDNLDYNQVLPDLKAIVHSAQEQISNASMRRKRRRVEIKPEWMKEQGKIARDFAFIPCRVIDQTISREQTSYVAFLKGERRIAAFKTSATLNGQVPDVQVLEERFTAGMTYPGWELPFVQCQDGGALHGWDAVEVVFDPSRDLHVDIEHIGHDRLLFSRDALDIQNCPNVLRMYEFTKIQLDRAVKEWGFNAEQVRLLCEKFDSTDNKEKTIPVYKRFFRLNGAVHVAWLSITESCCTDWLKAPQPLFLGIKHKALVTVPVTATDSVTGMPVVDMLGQPVMTEQTVEQWVDTPINNYPIFIYRYRITEDHELMRQAGRGDLDKDMQEAQTATVSSFVTGCLRACATFASPRTDVKSSKNVTKLESTILEDGGLYDSPLEFFNRPFPDPGMLRGIQYLSVQHQNDTNQTNFAVQNREDSRKTATEIQAASQQASQLSSVQVTMFSIFLREVYSFCWQIVQSRCLQGLYVLVPMNQQNPLTGEIIIVNNDELVGLPYDIRAAGDFDIVQRAEKLDRMSNFLPLVANTAAAQLILGDMMALAFPEDADRYRRALAQMPAMMQLVNGIVQSLGTIGQGLPPDKQQQIMQLIQQLQQQAGGQP